MIRFAANLTMLYPQLEFLDRFTAARSDGFEGVEFLFPYEHPAPVLRSRLVELGLEQVLFNAPAGDWDAGERGIAGLPGRESEFKAAWTTALEYAEELRCPRVHVMAGAVQPGRIAPRTETYQENLAWAAAQSASVGVDLLVEPLNPRDVPGYLITTQADAHRLVADLGLPNVGVQLDLYHLQLTEGDVTTTLRRDLPTGRVRHLQIAGAPDRHEPDLGELDLGRVLGIVEELGYDGWIGCEYHPYADTSAGLAWIDAWTAR